MMLLEAEVTEHIVLEDCSRSVDWAGIDALSTLLDETLADLDLESDGKIVSQGGYCTGSSRSTSSTSSPRATAFVAA